MGDGGARCVHYLIEELINLYRYLVIVKRDLLSFLLAALFTFEATLAAWAASVAP